MRASEIAALPIRFGAAVRSRRLFHPVGVLANGGIERLAADGDGLPIASGPIAGRVSKALGVPGDLPDIAGLAWRMPSTGTASRPWDVLLATAGLGDASVLANRLLLRPVTSWSNTLFSSLMPLRHGGDLWWVRARLTTAMPSSGLSLDSVVDRIAHGGLQFDIEQACGTGSFEPLARMNLNEVIPAAEHPDDDVAFDPARNSAPGVELWPGWLRRVRRQAYDSSREGRDAQGASS